MPTNNSKQIILREIIESYWDRPFTVNDLAKLTEFPHQNVSWHCNNFATAGIIRKTGNRKSPYIANPEKATRALLDYNEVNPIPPVATKLHKFLQRELFLNLEITRHARVFDPIEQTTEEAIWAMGQMVEEMNNYMYHFKNGRVDKRTAIKHWERFHKDWERFLGEETYLRILKQIKGE